MDHKLNNIWQEKNRSTFRKTYPRATLDTTNPTSTSWDFNPGLSGGKQNYI